MKRPAEPLENLLALRRDERPEEGYWQDFLVEFHHRQRHQSVRKSPVALWPRLLDAFADLGPSKWVYGSGLAYAALTVSFFLIPHRPQTTRPFTAPVHREIPASHPATEQPDRLDLSPSPQGSTGEQVF